MRIFEFLKKSDSQTKKIFWLFVGSFFLVYLNYSLVRASTTTLFFEAYGAKSSPSAWVIAVVFLSLAIYACNRLQSRFSVQKVFLWASLFSAFIFLTSLIGFYFGQKNLSSMSFIWKEIYIVIQVHLLLAYANNFFSKDDFKLLIGPMGAIGSLGGVLGGLLTSSLSVHGTLVVLSVGLLFVITPAFVFCFTPSLHHKNEKRKAPLQSLNTPLVRKYVFTIALIVAMTQFIINIADFNFNLAFESAISESSERTSYLGHVYSITNLLTFLFQFLAVPFLLTHLNEKKYHVLVPLSYLFFVGLMVVFPGAGLLPIASLYIYFKASDYSIFSAGKEILYQPLNTDQKYGAKYLTDMLVYRASKALIAAALIYLQSSFILNMMMVSFLVIWLMLVIKLFSLHRQLIS